MFEALFLVTFFLLLAIYTFRANWDIDIYWHIKAGEWMVENLAIPGTDIFSASDPERAWTPFQWLYEVLVHEVASHAGFFWIRVLHAGLFLGSFALLYRLFRKRAPSLLIAGFLLALALILAEDRLRVRPEVFNFFFFAFLLPDLMSRDLGRWRAFRLVAVSILWANLHAGGALLLPLSAAALAFGHFLTWLARRDDPVTRTRMHSGLAKLALATLPMLPMPGFVKGVYTAFAMYQDSMVLIPEWHPPTAYFYTELAGRLTTHHVVCGIVPYLLLFTVGGIAVLGLRRGGWKGFVTRRDMGLLSLAFLLVLLGAKSARFIYLDAVALFLLVLVYRDEIARVLQPLERKLVVVALSGVMLGISFEYSVLIQRRGLTRALGLLKYDHEPGMFPERASDAIAGMGLQGRIFHSTSWGGYLIWRHFPQCTVFTDGRGNFTLDEREVLVATHRPYEREEALEDAWRRYPFDIVVFPSPVFHLLTWDRQKWMLAYRDSAVEVFLRISPENRDNVKRVLGYWAARGVETSGGPEGFQDAYQKNLGKEIMEHPRSQGKLKASRSRLNRPAPMDQAAGSYDRGMLLFSAGRWEEAEGDFQRIKELGFRHSTASLYLAWSRYLTGDADGARQALAVVLFERNKPDHGPLKWRGKQILRLLAGKLGVLQEAPPVNN